MSSATLLSNRDFTLRQNLADFILTNRVHNSASRPTPSRPRQRLSIDSLFIGLLFIGYLTMMLSLISWLVAQ